MYGIKKCSGSCLYCSAASTMNYNEDGNKNTFKFDRKKTKKKILEFTKVKEILKEGNSAVLTIDIWGGNPLENFNEFKQVVDFCYNDLKDFKEIHLHTSGNGLELRDDEKVQYLIDNDIHYQLSHDGCGQFLRTGIIDPLYWKETKDNIVKLTKLGILDWINTTLNARNYSFFENIKYWNKWRFDNNLMDKDLFIKLNHISDGTPPITKKWIFDDYKTEYKCVIPPKKGEEIGDLCFHDKILSDYLHEFRKLAFICMTPGINTNPEFSPFCRYIQNQTGRWQILDEKIYKNGGIGSCRQFQMGITDFNFVIDTTGNYCQCNLIDSSSSVKDPSGKRLAECESCEYNRQAECFPCGSENFPKKCEYMYAWCQTLEELAQLKEVLNLYNNNNENCDCKHTHKDPVFCVKDYQI